MLKRVLQLLRNRWTLYFIGCLLLALILWIVGPLVAIAGAVPLGHWWARLLLIGLIFGSWGLLLWRDRQKAKKGNDALVADLSAGGQDSGADSAETAVMAQKMSAALAVLKDAKLGTGGTAYLYELPWYAIIGPPGSGKTTILLNSGLKFPVASEGGEGPVAGVGGTRDCDWWFTDRAVLIDTAGRYTTQDSRAERDKAGWLGFLQILKKNRPRQPLNGIIIAMSVTDLLGAPDQVKAHAAAIRVRVQELYTQLGLTLPVYFVLTKLDLLVGFTQFFDALDREDREQVWGTTLRFERNGDPQQALAQLEDQFAALLATLNARVVERLHQETDPDVRAAIYGFPQQISALQAPLRDFVRDVFGESRFDKPVLLRGLYLTSGTQDGTPMDRVLGAINARFGVSPSARRQMPSSGRSYFITTLLSTVIIGEAGLVGSNPVAERRLQRLRMAGVAAGAVVLAAMLGYWGYAYVANRQQLAKLDSGVKQLANTDAGANRIAAPDFLADLERLRTLRTLAYGPDAPADAKAAGFSLGVGQDGKMQEQVSGLYHQELQHYLLPKMLLRLETAMGEKIADPGYLYEALKVYLMLGKLGPLDPATVQAWFRSDWAGQYGASGDEQVPLQLEQHLAALLEVPLTPPPLDGPLIERSREAIRNLPLAQRVYGRIKMSELNHSVPDWNFQAAAGSQATQLFVRASGRPLAEPIPGLFTRDGYFKAFLPALDAETSHIKAENWVFGDKVPPASEAEMRTVKLDTTRLYAQEFIATWQAFNDDIRIVAAGNLSSAASLAQLASGPLSPLKQAMIAMAAATDVSLDKTKARQGMLAKAGVALVPGAASAYSKVGGAMGADAGGAALDPRAEIERYFQPLRDAVKPGSTLDQGIDQLKTLSGAINGVVAAAAAGSGQDAAANANAQAAAMALKSSGSTLPAPAGAIMQTFSTASSSGLVGAGRSAATKAFGEKISLNDCGSALGGRYPFVRADRDVTIDDFGRYFSPGGILPQYVATNLKTLVDTTAAPWHASPAGTAVGVSAGTVKQFERANDISQMFFSQGGMQPSLQYQIEVVALDPATQRFTLTIDQQTLAATPGAKVAVAFRWPDLVGTGGAKAEFLGAAAPATPTAADVRNWDGRWALFRMLSDGKAVAGKTPDEVNFSITSGQHKAVLRLRAASVRNPFSGDRLAGFQCPTSL